MRMPQALTTTRKEDQTKLSADYTNRVSVSAIQTVGVDKTNIAYVSIRGVSNN